MVKKVLMALAIAAAPSAMAAESEGQESRSVLNDVLARSIVKKMSIKRTGGPAEYNEVVGKDAAKVIKYLESYPDKIHSIGSEGETEFYSTNIYFLGKPYGVMTCFAQVDEPKCSFKPHGFIDLP